MQNQYLNNQARKIVLFSLFLISTISFGQFRFGPQIGLNISNVIYWDTKRFEYIDKNLTPKIGLNMGLSIDHRYNEHSGIMSGLFLSEIGYVEEAKGGNYSYYGNPKSITTSFYTLLIPIDYSYSWYIDKFRILGYGGPGFGLFFGSKKVEVYSSNPNYYSTAYAYYQVNQNTEAIPDYVVSESSKTAQLTLFCNVGLGLEYKNMMLKTSCEAVAISKDENRLLNYNISLAYLFGGNN